jgi:hypothetical protein
MLSEDVVSLLLNYMPNLGEAVLVLLVGWIIAVLGSTAISMAMEKREINKKIWKEIKEEPTDNPKAATGHGIYKILVFVALLSFVGALGLGWVTFLMLVIGIAMTVVFIIQVVDYQLSKTEERINPPTK